MSTHNIINQFFVCIPTDLAVCAPRVRGGGGRERSGVGALTISFCRRVCHGVRGGHGGDGPAGGASLALGTSCGQSSNSMQ